MAITSGNDNIRIRHEQARALNQEQIDAAKNASTAEKDEAVSIMQEAWSKVNTHEGGESAGVIQEFGADLWGAITATGTAGLEIIEDAVTQEIQDAKDTFNDFVDSVDEGLDLTGNVLTNIWNGFKSVGSFLFGGISSAFEQGTLQGHEDEQAKASQES